MRQDGTLSYFFTKEDVAAMIVKYGDEGGDQSRLNWGRFVDRIVPRDYTTRVSQRSVNYIQSTTFSQLHSVNIQHYMRSLMYRGIADIVY